MVEVEVRRSASVDDVTRRRGPNARGEPLIRARTHDSEEDALRRIQHARKIDKSISFSMNSTMAIFPLFTARRSYVGGRRLLRDMRKSVFVGNSQFKCWLDRKLLQLGYQSSFKLNCKDNEDAFGQPDSFEGSR